MISVFCPITISVYKTCQVTIKLMTMVYKTLSDYKQLFSA